jgi:hypothetical protein
LENLVSFGCHHLSTTSGIERSRSLLLALLGLGTYGSSATSRHEGERLQKSSQSPGVSTGQYKRAASSADSFEHEHQHQQQLEPSGQAFESSVLVLSLLFSEMIETSGLIFAVANLTQVSPRRGKRRPKRPSATSATKTITRRPTTGSTVPDLCTTTSGITVRLNVARVFSARMRGRSMRGRPMSSYVLNYLCHDEDRG